MTTFSQWNQALIDFFFNEDKEGQSVKLDIDNNMLDEEFPEFGGAKGFCRAVVEGPDWRQVDGHQNWLNHLNDIWEISQQPIDWRREHNYPVPTVGSEGRSESRPPIFMPYLAFSCYLWTLDAELEGLTGGANAYFDPFNQFLYRTRNRVGDHCPDRGDMTSPIFGNQFMPLWQELEEWASNRCNNKFGSFQVVRLIPEGFPGTNVSVPRAQVLLSGTNRKRLGYLFDQMGLRPDMPITADELRSRLIDNEAISQWALGKIGYSHATSDSHATNRGGFSAALLKSIIERFEAWDGEVIDARAGQDGNNHANRVVASGMAVSACLERREVADGDYRWRALAYCFDDRHQSGIIRASFPVGQPWNLEAFECILGDNPGHYFQRESDRREGFPFRKALLNSASLKAKWFRGEDQDETDLFLRVRPAKVRFFIPNDVRSINRNRFLRERGLPGDDDGAFWVLVSPEAIKDWNDMFEDVDGIQLDNDFKWEDGGEHDIGTMWKVNSVALMTGKVPEWMSRLGIAGTRRADTFARLIGGTRIRGYERRFSAIDPPSVAIDLPAYDENIQQLIEVRCDGAPFEIKNIVIPLRGKGIDPNNNPRPIDLSSPQTFQNAILKEAQLTMVDGQETGDGDTRLILDIGIPDRPQTQLSLVSVHLSVGNRKKAIQLRLDWKEYEKEIEGVPAMDARGRPSAAPPAGISGCRLTHGNADGYPAADGTCQSFPPRISRPRHPVDDRGAGIDAYDFMSFLNLRGSASYTRALEYLETRYSPSWEMSILWKLGHVELGKDASGRWRRVHALPTCVYELPSRHCDGRRQFVVSGTIQPEKLKKLRGCVGARGLVWVSAKQLGWEDGRQLALAPRLEMILSDDDAKVRDAASESQVEFIKGIPGANLVEWSEDLQGWWKGVANNGWQVDLPELRDSQAFNPVSCEWERNQPQPGNIALRRAKDRITGIHHAYQMSRPCQNREGETERADILQPEWAQWRVVKESFPAGNQELSIAYHDGTGCLDIPFQLDLPPVLAKALALCSGYAPMVVQRNPGFWPFGKGAFVSHRKMIRYHAVPREIAQKALAKVGANLLSVS